jgi:hypothetical protein
VLNTYAGLEAGVVIAGMLLAVSNGVILVCDGTLTYT